MRWVCRLPHIYKTRLLWVSVPSDCALTILHTLPSTPILPLDTLPFPRQTHNLLVPATHFNHKTPGRLHPRNRHWPLPIHQLPQRAELHRLRSERPNRHPSHRNHARQFPHHSLCPLPRSPLRRDNLYPHAPLRVTKIHPLLPLLRHSNLHAPPKARPNITPNIIRRPHRSC